MRRHETAPESAPFSLEGKSPATASLLKHADLLARWCESALESVRAHPKQFGDLDVAGLEFGITFLRRRLIPHVATGGTLPPVAMTQLRRRSDSTQRSSIRRNPSRPRVSIRVGSVRPSRAWSRRSVSTN